VIAVTHGAGGDMSDACKDEVILGMASGDLMSIVMSRKFYQFV